MTQVASKIDIIDPAGSVLIPEGTIGTVTEYTITSAGLTLKVTFDTGIAQIPLFVAADTVVFKDGFIGILNVLMSGYTVESVELEDGKVEFEPLGVPSTSHLLGSKIRFNLANGTYVTIDYNKNAGTYDVKAGLQG